MSLPVDHRPRGRRMTRHRRVHLLLWGGTVPLVGAFSPLPYFPRGVVKQNEPQNYYFSLLHYSSSVAESPCASDTTTVACDDSALGTPVRHKNNLPPWLSHYQQYTDAQVQEQIQWLEYTLMEQGFLVADITQVVSAVQGLDSAMAAGVVDFLRLLLSLRSNHHQDDNSGTLFVTTPVLLASIVHYTDCVEALRNDMTQALGQALLGRQQKGDDKENTIWTATKQQATHLLLPGLELVESVSPILVTTSPQQAHLGNTPEPVRSKSSTTANIANDFGGPYQAQVKAICKGAARVKRAECLAQAVLQVNDNNVAATTTTSPTQAARLRDLYLMCMDQDWRSLALRVVACWYRLEGLIRAEGEFKTKSPQAVQVARQAMHIYAPLAQRLGMHRLKAMIEERAFCLQYRRQYRAVSALYHETGEAMQRVSVYLQSHVRQILQNDEALVAQIQTLQVAARVKEPYSFWRKLLNQKVKGLLKPSNNDQEPDRRTLSITQVNDAVALRVILTARKLTPDEPDEVTRAREGMLCYYVHHLIRAQWPETDATRLKDYIANPKPNGYQSLHHTSQIASRGILFPFEVQVRSAQMHAQAEFGVSAHWDYKLSGRDSSLKSAAPAMALPPQDLDEALAAIAAQDWQYQDLLPQEPTTTTKSAVADGYVDALVTAKEEMVKNQIYIFIMGNGKEQGELIAVPVNSSVGDAIQEIEDLIPAKVQVWKNGRPARPTDKLENGDVMMIAI